MRKFPTPLEKIAKCGKICYVYFIPDARQNSGGRSFQTESECHAFHMVFADMPVWMFGGLSVWCQIWGMH